jgi:hypothetical protein
MESDYGRSNLALACDFLAELVIVKGKTTRFGFLPIG